MPAIRLAQVRHRDGSRRLARVAEPNLLVLDEFSSVFAMAQAAIGSGQRIAELLARTKPIETLDYDAIYRGESDWKLLPCFDHPSDPSRCLVTGTGLTHRASAENRQSMHGSASKASSATETVTDSMRMYRIGLEGGRPARGEVGAQPEWFYKGAGAILRAHNDPLRVPCFAHDGGEEAEIAGIYTISRDGVPFRVGLAQGNEFSDHVLEAKNYLYLAQSKLRDCSIGPELVIDADFEEVRGRGSIERGGKTAWQAEQSSGEKWMCHTLANLEHHHFKIDSHRVPGDVHVHFFGADAFSFRDRLELKDGDVMTVAFEGFGRPLRNPIRIDRSGEKFVGVKVL